MKNMFDSLRQIVLDVNDATGLEQALNIVVKRTREVMSVDAVSVYFRDKKTDQLVLMASDGLNQQAIGNIRFEQGQGLVGQVLDRAEPLNINDAHVHPNYRFVTETGEISLHGFLGVPIIQHRHVLGVLVVRRREKRLFSAVAETFLVTLAAQLAGAISYAEKMGELNSLIEGGNNHSFNMKGLSGSPGVAIGEAMVVFPPASLDAVPDNTISEDEIGEQIDAFNEAVNNVER
jgi:phosphotransferase system, enzyme I, PtsP